MLPLLLALAAAQTPPAVAAPAPAPPPASSRRFTRTFISPMGEPFRASDRDGNTLADWFQQADRNHDGQLTLAEMQQDAERFFATLDVNHDGEIDPDDVTRYENVVAPEILSGGNFLMTDGDRPSGGGRHRRAGFIRADRDDGHQGGARFGLLDLPEPVVSADFNFNRGVSLTEFRQAAAQRFIALDVDHKGMLTLAVLENIHPAPPPGKQPVRKRPTGDESASPSTHQPRQY